MNTEEREYWLQIMPIMSEDQITKFQGILLNEKNQLAKLDQEYATETESAPAQAPKFNEVTIKEKLANIRKEENLSKAGEQKEEEELFKHLQNL